LGRILYRNKDYLDFVRAKPCIVHYGCGLITEAHHWRTKGSQMNDFYAVPLCAEHHREFHSIGKNTFLKKYFMEESYVYDCMIQVISEYVKHK